MKVRIVAVGKARRSAFATLTEEYLGRTRRFGGVELVRVEPRAGSDAERARTEEGERLLARVGRGARVVMLDERGEAWTSERWADWLADCALRGALEVDFVLGGAHGLSPEVRARADRVVQLSPATLPHELALVVVAEQVYRAFTLWRGERYHHA